MVKKHIYTAEQITFVENNITGKPHVALLRLFNERFKTELTVTQLYGLCVRQRFFSGLGKTFTDLHIQFLKEQKENKTYNELTQLFNEHFKTSFSTEQIYKQCRYQKLSMRRSWVFTAEQIAFLKECAEGKKYSELTMLFNKQFDAQLTTSQIAYACRERGISNKLVWKFTTKQLEFLGKNAKKYDYKQLKEVFNHFFKTCFSTKQIRSVCQKRGFLAGKYFFYSKEHIDFIRKNIKNFTYKKLTQLFNTTFGVQLELHHIANVCFRQRILTDRNMRFKYGHYSQNRKPVGAERINKGFTEVKTALPSQWKKKHRVLWALKYGAIPETHKIIFADRNKTNCCSENLLCLSKKAVSYMICTGLLIPDRELTKTGATIAQLAIKVREQERKLKQEVTNVSGS